MDITIDLKDSMETIEGHRLKSFLQIILSHSQWKNDIEDISLEYGCEREYPKELESKLKEEGK